MSCGQPHATDCRVVLEKVYLYLDGVVRKASGTDLGDMVDVSVVFDEAYTAGPQHEMLPHKRLQV